MPCPGQREQVEPNVCEGQKENKGMGVKQVSWLGYVSCTRNLKESEGLCSSAMSKDIVQGYCFMIITAWVNTKRKRNIKWENPLTQYVWGLGRTTCADGNEKDERKRHPLYLLYMLMEVIKTCINA